MCKVLTVSAMGDELNRMKMRANEANGEHLKREDKRKNAKGKAGNRKWEKAIH